MNTENSNSAGSFPRAREHTAVLLLCLLAAIHVFVYGAAFPFFNNVDEAVHLDLVLKYAHGAIPRQLESISGESLKLFAIYGAPTYMTPGTNTGEFFPQPWKLSADTQSAIVRLGNFPSNVTNEECSQPPGYYMVAGDWWRLAGLMGLNDGQKLYGLHFLNVPIICILVWLGWFAAKQVFPDRIFPRIAVPAIIACMPQSAFYSIENDVLSPLCFGAAFACILRFLQSEPPGWRLGAITGLALAATFLTKMTNVPLLAACMLAIAMYIWHWGRKGSLRQALPGLLALSICAALPALVWMGWCLRNYGDLTGSQPKVEALTWLPKPFPEWFHHPVFSLQGAWTFWSYFVSAFWQGEMFWHKQPLRLPGVSWFCQLTTTFLLLVTLSKIIRHPPPGSQAEYRALRFSFLLFASAITFMVFISIRFDFNECFYPSRAFPFLVSGRLALGALIPFMLLFVGGLDRILHAISLPLKFLILAAFTLGMLVAEFATDKAVFFDQYNWYHM